MKNKYKDWRFLLLTLALIATLIACLLPMFPVKRNVYNWLVMIDITRSMNARDYTENNVSISRLAKIKKEITQ
ncbi:MAG: VWA domain-containing protein, partial [Proteobacteria bacterium]|nr:VWA domain-containing protein [Pseudomonadota bacterium]